MPSKEEAKSRLNGRIKDLEESLLREKERNIKVCYLLYLRYKYSFIIV